MTFSPAEPLMVAPTPVAVQPAHHNPRRLGPFCWRAVDICCWTVQPATPGLGAGEVGAFERTSPFEAEGRERDVLRQVAEQRPACGLPSRFQHAVTGMSAGGGGGPAGSLRTGGADRPDGGDGRGVVGPAGDVCEVRGRGFEDRSAGRRRGRRGADAAGGGGGAVGAAALGGVEELVD